MSIKPIDLQVNMSHLSEVGKGEQARTEALVEQQHVLEKEASEQSRLVNSRLDEMEKGERTAIREDEGKKKEKQRKQTRSGREEEGEEKTESKKSLKDDKMGRIIDVLK